ncbi:SCO family protein [Cohnella hongkongensis]|uniref:SCO family protein n=1 Tax=Cohnella hongkongensis TaxID=178337 RepID=A0ABV9F578_9BACL
MDLSKEKKQGEEQQSAAPAEEVVVEPVKADRPQKPWLQRYGFSLVVLALCIVMGYFILEQQNKKDELPVQGPGVEFSYADMYGENVSLSGTNGKVRLLYFFFANCPDVCPPTTFVMSEVQDELMEQGLFGTEVQFLSVTIDPERDTPEMLQDYAKRFEADREGWKFLRGDEQETAALAREYGVFVQKDNEGNFGHMNVIVLLDKQGQIRDWISANDYIDLEAGAEKLSPSELTRLIKSLL